MPRRRNQLSFPSLRNLRLYHELAYNRCTQLDLAKNWKISQCRVSQLCRAVRAWVDSLVPKRQFRNDHGHRFHLAIARERIRLHEAYEPLLATFTGADGFPRSVRRFLTADRGQPVIAVEISNTPNYRHLSLAVDVAARQAQLETIALLGPFADLPNQHRQSALASGLQPAPSEPFTAPTEINY